MIPTFMHTVWPYEWNSGSAIRTTSLPGSASVNHARACAQFATKLKCVSMTPFDTPVVPPVYCNSARSSFALTGVCCTPPLAVRITSFQNRTGSLRGTGAMTDLPFFVIGPSTALMPLNASNTFVTITSRSFGSSFLICLIFGYIWSITTRTSTPASFSWCSSSRSVYRGLFSTMMPPRRSAA